MNPQQFPTLEERILSLQAEVKQSPISIGEIFAVLSGKGRALILILLSLPFCQPLHIPGLSTPFGLAIAFVGLRLAFGKHLWLPKRFLAKTISPHVFTKVTDAALTLIRKLRYWIHPRLDWICNHPVMQIVNGLVIFVLGILLALPLPIPLSNLTAAWSILLIALGTIEDDGLFVLLGYVIFLVTIVFFALMLIPLKYYVLNNLFT